jgi:hypothetical protein
MEAILTPTLGNWLSALITLMLFSILYKENPFYRIAEHLYVGASAAHGIVTTWNNTVKPALTDMPKYGTWWEILPMLLGLMIYFNFYRPYAWLARIPMALWIGYNAALVLSARQVIPFLNQLTMAIKPLVAMTNGGFDLAQSINNILFVSIVLGVLTYFLFTVEHKGVFKYAADWGRIAIMIGFGASFGNTVMARISLLIGRLDFLFGDWLGLLG